MMQYLPAQLEAPAVLLSTRLRLGSAWELLTNARGLPNKYPDGYKFRAFGFDDLTLQDASVGLGVCLVVSGFLIAWVRKHTRKLNSRTAALKRLQRGPPPEDE